jgi:hypothetical protein
MNRKIPVYEERVPYTHHTVQYEFMYCKYSYFKYKDERFHVSVSGTLYAVESFWFGKTLEVIKTKVNVNN